MLCSTLVLAYKFVQSSFFIQPRTWANLNAYDKYRHQKQMFSTKTVVTTSLKQKRNLKNRAMEGLVILGLVLGMTEHKEHSIRD